MVISFIDVARLVSDAGFPTGTSQATFIAIIDAESGRNPNALHINEDAGGTVRSVDRGICQINNVAHPEVSGDCAYDPKCAIREALRISSNGTNFKPWSAFNNGAYLTRIDAAKVALDGLRRERALEAEVAVLEEKIAKAQADLA